MNSKNKNPLTKNSALTDPEQVRQSIEKAKHPWVKAKLEEIFELSLKLVEEFDGQNYAVYTSDDFTRKSIPVMEAMASQKQGKKLFLGVVSNSLVGVANKMSFFWWTPTRLMSKNDLKMMSAHVETLKARLAQNDMENNAVAEAESNEWNHIEEEGFIEGADIDEFSASDGETEKIITSIAQKKFNESLVITPAPSDDNGNSDLPVPTPMSSTPKPTVDQRQTQSQKQLLNELRRSRIEQGRLERQDSLADARRSWSSLLQNADDEEPDQNMLRLNLSFKNTGGISYKLYM